MKPYGAGCSFASSHVSMACRARWATPVPGIMLSNACGAPK
jgi:hypothetical protein